MNGFDEVTLPLPFALGASGGPERRVDVVALGSGAEVRNTPWAHGRRRYDVGGAVRTLDDVHTLIAFFEARRGRLRGFRLRDPFDWKSCGPMQTLTPMDQNVGVGDGAAISFQLCKTYGAGEGAYIRPIRKPVSGTVRIAVDGVELSGVDFAVDTATGIVTFEIAPAFGAIVSAGYHFDTPVRFDAERLDLSLEGFGAGRALAAPLLEILV